MSTIALGESRIEHEHVVEAVRNLLLALPECLPQQTFEPVADDGLAMRFADGDTYARITTIILRHVERQQPITEAPTMSEYGLKLPVIDKPLVLGQGKTLHRTLYGVFLPLSFLVRYFASM